MTAIDVEVEGHDADATIANMRSFKESIFARLVKEELFFSVAPNVGHAGTSHAQQFGGAGAEHVTGRTGRSPDGIERQQILVQQQQRRGQVTHRGDAADGEARRLAHPVGVRPAKLHAERRGCLSLVHPIGARR